MDEVGSVTEAQSRKLKPMFLYHSVMKPGYMCDLTWCRGDYCQCAHCQKLGKKRVIAIRHNSIVVGNKHPEDDHHEKCELISEIGKIVINYVSLSTAV